MNCKPGDLAIVIRASRDENIGKIVHVIKQVEDHDLFGPSWAISAESILNVTDFKSPRQMTRRPGAPLNCPDAWLRPISGLPVDDEVPTEIKEPA